MVWFMVFNTIFNNISVTQFMQDQLCDVIVSRQVISLLVEETGENH
jgi:hypothetical protein